MLVRHRMTQQPVTVSPRDALAAAQEKMTTGHFRRLPGSEQPIFYVRLRGVDAAAASAALQNKRYTVLSAH
jgi:CBS domain-containing protein